MPRIQIAAAAALAASCSAAAAQEVTGGDVTLSYSRFSDDLRIGPDEYTLSKASLGGSVEVGLRREISIQGDLAFHEFGFLDETGTALGIHGIYHANETSSVGVFYTTDSIENLDANYFGIEVGSQLGVIDAETYLSLGSGGDDSTIVGLAGSYDITPQFSLGAGLDYYDGDGSSRQIALEAAYDVTDTLGLAANLGTSQDEFDGVETSDAFFGLSATYTFGAARGATFERRGLQAILRGF